jgi:hypothetical protein
MSGNDKNTESGMDPGNGMDRQPHGPAGMPGDEAIGAWLDGALAPEGLEAMERLTEDQDQIAARLDRLRHLDGLVREAVPAEETIPAELLARLGLAEDQAAGQKAASVELRAAPARVIDLAAARAARTQERQKEAAAARRPSWFGRMAQSKVAAQVILLAGVGLVAALWHFPGGGSGGDLPRAAAPAAPAEYRALGDAPGAEDRANVVVMFDPALAPDRARALAQAAGAELIGSAGRGGTWRALVPAEGRDAALARLRASPGVTLAEPIDGAVR